jgi:DNA-binding MarR family transcriptional regulator
LKIEYRIGVPPGQRKTKCETAIRNALRQGKKTFGNLLDETDLSRSTLAFHLKEMHKKGHVERETDPKDYRIRYYSLTSKGRGEVRRQEDIDTLASAEFLLFSPEIISGLTDALIKFLEPSIRQHILTLEEKDSNLLKECITYSIYSDSLLKNEVREYASELAELATASMLSEFVISTQRQVIKKMPNISLVFKFDKDKIEKYLQKVED